jgi:hypothetical protein
MNIMIIGGNNESKLPPPGSDPSGGGAMANAKSSMGTFLKSKIFYNSKA